MYTVKFYRLYSVKKKRKRIVNKSVQVVTVVKEICVVWDKSIFKFIANILKDKENGRLWEPYFKTVLLWIYVLACWKLVTVVTFWEVQFSYLQTYTTDPVWLLWHPQFLLSRKYWGSRLLSLYSRYLWWPVSVNLKFVIFLCDQETICWSSCPTSPPTLLFQYGLKPQKEGWKFYLMLWFFEKLLEIAFVAANIVSH